jgi:hypothetical protein
MTYQACRVDVINVFDFVVNFVQIKMTEIVGQLKIISYQACRVDVFDVFDFVGDEGRDQRRRNRVSHRRVALVLDRTLRLEKKAKYIKQKDLKKNKIKYVEVR